MTSFDYFEDAQAPVLKLRIDKWEKDNVQARRQHLDDYEKFFEQVSEFANKIKKYNKLQHLNIKWNNFKRKMECGETIFATVVTIKNMQQQWTAIPKSLFMSRGGSGSFILGFTFEYVHPKYSQYGILFTLDSQQGNWTIDKKQELQVPVAYVFDFAEAIDEVHPSMRSLLQGDTDVITAMNTRHEYWIGHLYYFMMPNTFVIVNGIKYDQISMTSKVLIATSSDKVTICIYLYDMICTMNARNIPYHVAKKYAKNIPALVPHQLLGAGEYSMYDIPFGLAEDKPHPSDVEASCVKVSCVTDRFLIMGTYYTFPLPLRVKIKASNGWCLSHKFQLQDKSCTIAEYNQTQHQGDPEETPSVEESGTDCDMPFEQLLAQFTCKLVNLPSAILHSQVESIHLHMGDAQYPKEYLFFNVRAQDGMKYRLAFDMRCTTCSIYEEDKQNSAWLVLQVCDNDPIRVMQKKMLHHTKQYCDVSFE